jgi:hypothetical protein
MKLLFWSAVAFVFFLPLIVPVTGLSQARVQIVGGETLNFGEIYSNAKLNRKIVVRNVGKDTLSVKSVSTQCGCTVALASHDLIAPKDSGAINVTFDPRRFSGPVTKAISFETNDPSHQHVHINFNVNIIKVIEADPELVTIPDAMVDSATKVSYKIRNLSSTDTIHIFNVSTDSPNLKVDLDAKVLAPKEEVSVDCTYIPKKSGIDRMRVDIHTDNTHVPDLSTTVFARVK